MLVGVVVIGVHAHIKWQAVVVTLPVFIDNNLGAHLVPAVKS
jgi:hypothetical protein